MTNNIWYLIRPKLINCCNTATKTSIKLFFVAIAVWHTYILPSLLGNLQIADLDQYQFIQIKTYRVRSLFCTSLTKQVQKLDIDASWNIFHSKLWDIRGEGERVIRRFLFYMGSTAHKNDL